MTIHRHLECIRLGLLRQGVAPRYAARFVRDRLNEYDALVAQLRTTSPDVEQAAAKAEARVRNCEHLMAELTAQASRRAWVWQWPGTILVLGSALMFALSLAGAVVSVAVAERWLTPAAAQVFADMVVLFSGYIVPLLCGWTVITLSYRQRLRSYWPVVALALLALLSCGLTMVVTVPVLTAILPVRLEFCIQTGSYTDFVNFLMLTAAPYVGLTWYSELAELDLVFPIEPLVPVETQSQRVAVRTCRTG
jgi:uncharacterized paraquat-inducible protein A